MGGKKKKKKKEKRHLEYKTSSRFSARMASNHLNTICSNMVSQPADFLAITLGSNLVTIEPFVLFGAVVGSVEDDGLTTVGISDLIMYRNFNAAAQTLMFSVRRKVRPTFELGGVIRLVAA